MNKSIDIKLKDFYTMIGIAVTMSLSEEVYKKWLLEVDESYLSPFVIVDRLIAKYKQGSYKIPSLGQNADFLGTKEFDALSWQDKTLFFRSLNHKGLKKSANDGSIFSLDDYRMLLQQHGTDWDSHLKVESRKLIPETQLSNVTLDDLDSICFSEFQDIYMQNSFLEKVGVSNLFTNLTFKDLLSHPIFNRLSAYMKARLCLGFFGMEGCDEYSSEYDLSQLPLYSQYLIWSDGIARRKGKGNDFKKYSEPIMCLEDVHLGDQTLEFYRFENIIAQEWYKELPPEVKVGLIILCNRYSYAAEMIEPAGTPQKLKDTIINLSKQLNFTVEQKGPADLPPNVKNNLTLTFKVKPLFTADQMLGFLSSVYNLDSICESASHSYFKNIQETQGKRSLNPNLILKSNLPLNVKLMAYRFMPQEYKTADNLWLIAYPPCVSLLFQNLYKNVNSSAEDKEALIKRDLSQIEIMTRDYVTAVSNNYEMLGIEGTKAGILKSLWDDLKEDSDRVKQLAQIWSTAVSLNFVRSDSFFADWDKIMFLWFSNPKLQTGPVKDLKPKQGSNLQKEDDCLIF